MNMNNLAEYLSETIQHLDRFEKISGDEELLSAYNALRNAHLEAFPLAREHPESMTAIFPVMQRFQSLARQLLQEAPHAVYAEDVSHCLGRVIENEQTLRVAGMRDAQKLDQHFEKINKNAA